MQLINIGIHSDQMKADKITTGSGDIIIIDKATLQLTKKKKEAVVLVGGMPSRTSLACAPVGRISWIGRVASASVCVCVCVSVCLSVCLVCWSPRAVAESSVKSRRCVQQAAHLSASLTRSLGAVD